MKVSKIVMMVAVGSLTLTGCRSKLDYHKIRADKSTKHFAEIAKRTLEDKQYNLQECINLALKNNLDIQMQKLSEAIAKERRDGAVLGMLPDLNLSYSQTSRNNLSGSYSKDMSRTKNGAVNPDYGTTDWEDKSKSSENQESTFKIEAIFSILDFGLAYYSAGQADDKVLLTQEQTRRSAQNLAMSVSQSYYRVATAQHAIKTIETLVVICDDSAKKLAELAESNALSPVRLLAEKKSLLNLKRSLINYKRSYQNYCIELKSLMGVMPVGVINVDTTSLDKLEILETSTVEELEQIAIKNRPELLQLDIKSDILAIEAKKSILKMFPNVKFFANWTESSNKYLYNDAWEQIGMNASLNLLNLPGELKNKKALEIEADQLDVKTIALTVGVISQVRIAFENFKEVKERFDLSKEIYETSVAHFKAVEARMKTAGDSSVLAYNKLKFEVAEIGMRHTETKSNYYLAYHRLMNAVGIEKYTDSKGKGLTQNKTNGLQQLPITADDAIYMSGDSDLETIYIND